MHIIQELQADLKAEVVAAAYMARHPDISKVIIERLGDLSRSHTKDIYRLQHNPADADRQALLVLQSFRQGIYDAMPEHVFHPPTLGGVNKTEEKILEEIQLQRKREADARRFFRPFEQEVSYVEIQALLLEWVYERKGEYNNLLGLFDKAWPVVRRLPPATAIGFIYILPFLARITGNRLQTAQCLSFLIGLPVTVTEHYELQKVSRQLPSFTLGDNKLSIDSNFNGEQYDGVAGWDIHIGPVPEGLMDTILSDKENPEQPQTDFRQLLDTLSDYLLPAELSVRFFINAEKVADTILSPDRNTARLGYTFFL